MKKTLGFLAAIYVFSTCFGLYTYAQLQPLPPVAAKPVESNQKKAEPNLNPGVATQEEKSPGGCTKNQIELNTDIPFIGKCIDKTLETTANGSSNKNISNVFPVLMGGLARLLMSVILVGSFIAILVGGLMMASAGFTGKYDQGKSLIIKVLVGLALIGISGAILNAINPNFFKTTSGLEITKLKI